MSSDSARSANGAEVAPVGFPYIFTLTLFSVGTSSVSFCANQVLPATLKQFTDSTFLIGFIVALQALNQLWVTPYAAWKSDRIWTRIGRRKPLVLIMTPLLALTVGLVPHIPSLWLLVALVFILQMAEDAELAVMMPSISDSVPDRQRPLATGMYQFMLAASAFAMGRFAMKLMDRSEHWPYTIAAITVVVTGLIYLRVMRERYVPPRPRERFRLFAYGRDICRTREHLLIYVICFFQPLFVLVSSSFFVLLATKQMGMTNAQYGAALSWGSLTTLIICPPLGWLFIRWRHRKAVAMGCCIFAVVPMTWGLFFMRTPTDMAVFFAMQQFAFSVFRLNFFPLIMEYTTPENVATILGFTTAVNGMVRFTMIPLAGLLVDLAGKNYSLPLWGGYLGAAVCVAAFALMRPAETVDFPHHPTI